MQIVTDVDVSKMSCWLLPVEPQPSSFVRSIHADWLEHKLTRWKFVVDFGVWESPTKPGEVLEFWPFEQSYLCDFCGEDCKRFEETDAGDLWCWCADCQCEIFHPIPTPIHRTVIRVTAVNLTYEYDMWPVDQWEIQHPKTKCPEWVWKVVWNQ